MDIDKNLTQTRCHRVCVNLGTENLTQGSLLLTQNGKQHWLFQKTEEENSIGCLRNWKSTVYEMKRNGNEKKAQNYQFLFETQIYH